MAQAGPLADRSHPPVRGPAIESLTVPTAKNRPFVAFADDQVDGAGGARDEGDGGGLVALPGDPQNPVPTLDGSRVKVKVPAGTSSGTVLRVKGRGLRTKDGQGDLLATVEVAVPKKLSKAAKEALQTFALETASDEPRAALYRDASH